MYDRAAWIIQSNYKNERKEPLPVRNLRDGLRVEIDFFIGDSLYDRILSYL